MSATPSGMTGRLTSVAAQLQAKMKKMHFQACATGWSDLTRCPDESPGAINPFA